MHSNARTTAKEAQINMVKQFINKTFYLQAYLKTQFLRMLSIIESGPNLR